MTVSTVCAREGKFSLIAVTIDHQQRGNKLVKCEKQEVSVVHKWDKYNKLDVDQFSQLCVLMKSKK